MKSKAAACPHCRAKLGLRTVFALGDLWDPRIHGRHGLELEFRCYACAEPLKYPISTLVSFIALAVLPIVLMALLRDTGSTEWLSSIRNLMAPYWIGLGVLYSFLAMPIPSSGAPRTRRK